jgi:type I restriction enzyme S subunit
MVPYLRAANVTWRGVDTSDVKSMHFEPSEVDIYRLAPGDILLNEASGSPAEVGKPVLWRGSELRGDVCFQNTLLRVRADPRQVAPGYLLVVLRRLALAGHWSALSRGVGIAHIGRARLAELQIPLPPLAEQSRIAATLDEAMAIHGRLAQAWSEVSRRLEALQESICSFLWTQSANAPLLPVLEVATVSGGLQKSPARLAVEGRDAKFLRVANVLRLGLDLTDVHSVPISDAERGRVLLKPGDLLVVEGNGSLDELGRAAQWRGEVGDWTHQNHLIRVRPGVQLEPDFLEQIWASPQVRSQIRDVGASTSGLHTLSTKKVGAVRIPVPARSSQRRLADAAATLLQTRRVLLGHATRIGQSISALERSLLSAATTGRLVPQDPSDEPAELLLRRLEAEREAAAAESKPARTVRKRAAAAAKTIEESV